MDRSVRQILLALLIAALVVGGIVVRSATWEMTQHVRFQRDLVNGFYWGTETLEEAHTLAGDQNPDSWPAFFRGYLALYDRVEREAYETDYSLDYPPLRLLAMSIWTKYVRHEFPGVDDGHPDGVEPLLYINLVCELSTAIGIFLLVRFWVKRAAGATGSRYLHQVPAENRGWICGVAAASVAWLEPSMILDAHGWPQWDAWILTGSGHVELVTAQFHESPAHVTANFQSLVRFGVKLELLAGLAMKLVEVGSGEGDPITQATLGGDIGAPVKPPDPTKSPSTKGKY